MRLSDKERKRFQALVTYTSEEQQVIDNIKWVVGFDFDVHPRNIGEIELVSTMEGIDRQVAKAAVPPALIYYLSVFGDRAWLEKTATMLEIT